MKLAAVRVFVRDLDEATKFYAGALGLRVGARGPEADYVVFEAQTCDLIVERVSTKAPPEEQILVGRLTGLSFEVKNIAKLYSELTSKGVQFIGQPERQPRGGALATLSDPAGN